MLKTKKIRLFLLTLILILICFLNLFSLTSCNIDSSQIYDSLFPNVIVIIVHSLSTILLIILSIWIVWLPTKNKLEERREYISKVLNDSEKAKHESFKRLLDAENKRLDAYAEAENIIIRAKNESFFEYNEIIELAQKNSEIIKNDALKLADEYKKQIEVKNNEKILDLTLFATSKLLKAKLSKKDNEKFVSKFISDIKKEKKEK
ncbi:MAG: hypothetical protein LBB39_03090 [Mycoplasmataceae bacterium]|nr:hypothetical protein [Mycoplasmataceae bacterium]